MAVTLLIPNKNNITGTVYLKKKIMDYKLIII